MYALRPRTSYLRLEGKEVLLGMSPGRDRAALVQRLTEAGHRVVTALDGYHLVGLLSGHGGATSPLRPAIAIVDVSLPGSPGMALLDQIRQVDRETPVVLVVELNEPEIARRAFERGATRVFEKPLCVDELAVTVTTMLIAASVPSARPPSRRAGMGA